MDAAEQERLREVRRFLEIDFTVYPELQDIVDLATQLCQKPVGLITLLDEHSNWLKVRSGVEVEVMPRETSFCQYGIQQNSVLVIPGALKDQRFNSNPLVQSNPNLRFYAGAPLILNNGAKLGTLCLFDTKPGNITELQKKTLAMLSKQVTSILEREVTEKMLRQQVEEIQAKNESLRKIAQLQSHQVRQPLTRIMGLVNLVKTDGDVVDDTWLAMFEEATDNFDTTIKNIVAESIGAKDLKAISFNKMIEEIEDYAILLLDKDGNIENWNKGAEIIKGYKSTDIIGKHFSIFYTAKDRQENKPGHLLNSARKSGAATDQGWRVRKDGSLFWGRITITAIHDNDGQVIGFTKITRDFSDIRSAQELLRASEQRYAAMINEVEDYAIILLDVQGNIENWNAGAEKIKGYAAGEVIGKNFRIFYTVVDRENRLPDAILKEARQYGRARHEGWRQKKSGELFWGLVVITALHNKAGEIIGFTKVTKDLTDKKNAEEIQKRYVAQLEARNKKIVRLAYSTANRLQEPIGTIEKYLHFFAARNENKTDGEGKTQIDKIGQSVQGMRNLIKTAQAACVAEVDNSKA